MKNEVKRKNYEKILCLLEFIFSVIFYIISWLLMPIAIFPLLIGIVLTICFIKDIIKIIKHK